MKPNQPIKNDNRINCNNINEYNLVSKSGHEDFLQIPVIYAKKKDIKIDLLKDDIMNLIDNPENKIGHGTFNEVYSSMLSTKKCKKPKSVAVRIKELKVDIDGEREVIYTNEDTNYENPLLYDKLQKSVKNIILLSKKNVHPKVYSILIIEEKKTNWLGGEKNEKSRNLNKKWLVIIMEKYYTDLSKFLNYTIKFRRDGKIDKNKKKFIKNKKNSDGTVEELLESHKYALCNQKDSMYSEYFSPDCVMINEMRNQILDLITKLTKLNITCFDIKPSNIVLNYDFQIRYIELKLIDVDSDYCPNNLIKIENIDYGLNCFNSKQIYQMVMISLLAEQLYLYSNFNFMSFYFENLSKLFKDETDYNKFIFDILIYVNPKDDKKLEEIIDHYFKGSINREYIDFYAQHIKKFNSEEDPVCTCPINEEVISKLQEVMQSNEGSYCSIMG